MRLAAVTAGAARADVEAARPASGLRRLPTGRARRSASPSWEGVAVIRPRQGAPRAGGLLARLTQTRRAPLSAPRAHAPSPRGPAAAHVCHVYRRDPPFGDAPGPGSGRLRGPPSPTHGSVHKPCTRETAPHFRATTPKAPGSRPAVAPEGARAPGVHTSCSAHSPRSHP